MIRQISLLFLFLSLLHCGCRYQLGAVRPPDFDPDGASAKAMKQYDTNGDGKVDKKELKTAPGLNFALDRIDGNGDGAITAEELSTMIQEKWIDTGGGIIRMGVEVTLNGQALDGATVSFEPEPFLADVLHQATGETVDGGYAPMSMALEDMPDKHNRSGVAPGLYLVRISKEVGGKEMIPEKYNTKTTLGIEVATRASYLPGAAQFALRR